MTPTKRAFDVLVSMLALVLLSPLLAAIALGVWWVDGRPILYVAERMRSPTEGFGLIKFRTMRPATGDRGVSGGDKSDRITRTGGFLRRHRLDELPQLWNVVRGDISLVGPRPPLREYVERFPDTYGAVLASRPGITGLASVYAHGYEERLLAAARNATETDHLYARRCIPRKARLDLIYQQNSSLWLDLKIALKTVPAVLLRRGAK